MKSRLTDWWRSGTRAARVSRIGAVAVLVMAAAVLPLFRQTGVPSWRTLWAEDGFVYTQEASLGGPLAVLLRGHAGYLQLPPRLLGSLASVLPARHLAIYCAASATVLAASLAWFAWHAMRGWVDSSAVRLAVAALVVLMPALGPENTATISNTIWLFAAVAPWALVAVDERPCMVAARSAVAFLAATSTPLTFAFLPLGLGYLLRRRTKAMSIVMSAFLVGVALQGFVILHAEDTTERFMVRSLSQVGAYLSAHVFGMFLVGDRGVAALWEGSPTILIVGAPLVVALIVAVLLPGSGRSNPMLAGSFVVLAVITFVVPQWARGVAFMAMPGTAYHASGTRLAVVPIMLLASAVAVLVAPRGGARHQRLRRVSRMLFVAQIVVVTIVDFRVVTFRSPGPAWRTTVADAYRAHCIGSAPDTIVSLDTDFAHWFPVKLRCEQLGP